MDLPVVRAHLAVVDVGLLGERLRSARVAAGLTQSDVCRGLLSVSYLSRIEAGKRRLDADRLLALAERLGLDPMSLVDGPVGAVDVDPRVATESPFLDFAKIAVDMGDPEVALAHLAEHDLTGLSADEVVRAEKVRAKALEATGDLNAAIEVLARLLPLVEDDQERVPLATMLSRCHRELGELDDATRVGEDALARRAASALAPSVEVVQLRVTVAAAYVEKGELDHALRLCRQALAVAESIESPAARASTFWETSVIVMKKGDAAEAVGLARQALALMASGADDRILTRLRLHVGLMEVQLGAAEVASARDRLTAVADEMVLSHAPGTERLEVDLGLARCDLIEGDADAAWAKGQGLLVTAGRISLVSEADVLTLLGEAAVARGDLDGARRSLLQAAHRLHAVGSPREAGQRWMSLGAMLHGIGELEAGLNAYRAAAVSSGLQPGATFSDRTADQWSGALAGSDPAGAPRGTR